MADHDKLISGLQQMKAPLPDFGHEAVAADFAVHPVDVATNDLTFRRFRGEHALQPSLGMAMINDLIHGAILTPHG